MKKPRKSKQQKKVISEPPSLFDDPSLFSSVTATPTPPTETESGKEKIPVEKPKSVEKPKPMIEPADKRGGYGPLRDLMDNYFLQFASYTICNRAIPTAEDGLKPVQRRILHALHNLDDGRFIKVANVVGHTMQYHPHGDRSIGDALVNLTNKRYLIEGQGNFGNLFTGDPAAAPRYIECRLTELARNEIFNSKLTRYIPSYDGRNQEPVLLPAKLPLLLMLGADGIAVGLSTDILPHNFCELLEAQIAIIQKKPFKILPDFQTGGLMDVSEYEDGAGRIKLRAIIESRPNNRLAITALPSGETTDSLIRSIEDAIKKKRVPVREINDYTAEKVEVELVLPAGTKQEKAIQSLYAFTSCEKSATSRIVVLYRNRPCEMTVSEVLRVCTEQLLELLKLELEIRLGELDDLFHARTLEQIFIEERIYKLIEEEESYEAVQQAVFNGFEPFLARLRREMTTEDVERLLQIRIRRISRYDINRNREQIAAILEEEEVVKGHLGKLNAYAIRYLKGLLKKYRDQFPRLTTIAEQPFKAVEVRALTATELTIWLDRENGYLGTDIRGGEELFKCSSLDKIIVVWEDGSYKMMPPPEKLFVDKNHIYCAIFDRDKLFTAVYIEPDYGFAYIKRFAFGGAIQNREYWLAPKKSRFILFEEETPEEIYVKFKPAKAQRIHQQMFTPSEVLVKSARARGVQMTSKSIDRIAMRKPRWWKDDEDNIKGVL